MGAAKADIPAIALNAGTMLYGWFQVERTGSSTIVWGARTDGRRLGEARLYDLPDCEPAPAGECLAEEYYRAGGVPAVVAGAEISLPKISRSLG